MAPIGVKYRLSSYAHFFRHPKDDVDALWHSLSLELLFLDRRTSNSLLTTGTNPLDRDTLTSLLPSRSSDQQPSIEELTEAGFLVPELQDESDFPMQLAEKMEASRFIGVLYLMLFDGCNFRCTYCFENGREPRDFRPTMMPPAVAERGLELFASLYRKYPPPPGHEPKVQLYGGEPLLNRDAFIHAVRHFIRMKQSGQMDARVSLATVTN